VDLGPPPSTLIPLLDRSSPAIPALSSSAQLSLSGAGCPNSRALTFSPTEDAPPEDKYISKYYNALQYILYETNHPETKDHSNCDVTRRSQDIVSGFDKPTIVAFSSPVDCMGTLLEGVCVCVRVYINYSITNNYISNDSKI